MLAMARFAVLLAPMAITTGNLNLETAYRKLKDAAAGKDASSASRPPPFRVCWRSKRGTTHR
jgi:hypothetical protein